MPRTATLILVLVLAASGGCGNSSTPTEPSRNLVFFGTLGLAGTAIPQGHIMEGVLFLDDRELGRRTCPAQPPGSGSGDLGDCFPFILGPLGASRLRSGTHVVTFEVVRHSNITTGREVPGRLIYTAILTWGVAPLGAEDFTTTQEPNRTLALGPGDRVSWEIVF